MKVLLADDDAHLLDLLGEMLLLHEIEYQKTSSADEAIKALQREHFDLVITDYLMEKKGGELLHWVLKNALFTKIILYSSELATAAPPLGGNFIGSYLKQDFFDLEEKVLELKHKI